MAFFCDSSGKQIRDELIKKAKEGVKIRFIVDGVYRRTINRKCLKEMEKNGIEVVKIYDLSTKKSAGELAGVHVGSLTSLAISRDSQFVFSGAEDGNVVIWRLSDQGEPLHTLKVKNSWKVGSLSMH